MLMCSDGGLYRACRVLMLMSSDLELYRVFRVLRFMYSDGGLYKAYRVSRLITSVRKQLTGMPVYVRIFLDWMGFDKEAKRHFLTAFLISLAFLWNLVFETVIREP